MQIKTLSVFLRLYKYYKYYEKGNSLYCIDSHNCVRLVYISGLPGAAPWRNCLCNPDGPARALDFAQQPVGASISSTSFRFSFAPVDGIIVIGQHFSS